MQLQYRYRCFHQYDVVVTSTTIAALHTYSSAPTSSSLLNLPPYIAYCYRQFPILGTIYPLPIVFRYLSRTVRSNAHGSSRNRLTLKQQFIVLPKCLEHCSPIAPPAVRGDTAYSGYYAFFRPIVTCQRVASVSICIFLNAIYA